MRYNRSSNQFEFYVGGNLKFAIDASGLIQTAAFFSTEQTITNGSTTNVAHGLPSIPRWVMVRYGTASGSANATRLAAPGYVAPASSVKIEQVGA